jgi:hypothetical protein
VRETLSVSSDKEGPMSKRLTRIAVLGATALVLGLIAAPAAHA